MKYTPFIVVAALTLACARAAGVTCATGTQPSNPDEVYLVHGDGTVTDVRTGLMWKQCSEGQTYSSTACSGTATNHTWVEALDKGGSSFAAKSDWRLPNRNELQSLVEHCKGAAPLINDGVFLDTPVGMFWSSTPSVLIGSDAWYVDFNWGIAFNDDRYSVRQVRLVRAGQ